jgi:hypothetical protein
MFYNIQVIDATPVLPNLPCASGWTDTDNGCYKVNEIQIFNSL